MAFLSDLVRTNLRQKRRERFWTVADRPRRGEYQDDTSNPLGRRRHRKPLGLFLWLSIRDIRSANRVEASCSNLQDAAQNLRLPNQ